MIKLQQPLLILCKHIHRPFVLHLIALLVSGLIALLLGGAFMLSRPDTFVFHPVDWPLSIVICRAVQATPQ